MGATKREGGGDSEVLPLGWGDGKSFSTAEGGGGAQKKVFAVITIAAQTFPDIFGSPPSISKIVVSLNSYYLV